MQIYQPKQQKRLFFCIFNTSTIVHMQNLSYFCTAKSRNALLWMFHGVMAALEFLVLSVPVRIGVEQLPLPPESCSLSLLARLFFLSSVYTTLLFFVYVRKGWWIGILWYITLGISVCSYCALMVICFVS